MNYRFKTKCSPKANGRKPVSGDFMFVADFTTDEGAKLQIEMGDEGYQAFLTMLHWNQMDDERENVMLKKMLNDIFAAANGGCSRLRGLIGECEKELKKNG